MAQTARVPFRTRQEPWHSYGTELGKTPPSLSCCAHISLHSFPVHSCYLFWGSPGLRSVRCPIVPAPLTYPSRTNTDILKVLWLLEVYLRHPLILGDLWITHLVLMYVLHMRILCYLVVLFYMRIQRFE